jgi:hypothetical protein
MVRGAAPTAPPESAAQLDIAALRGLAAAVAASVLGRPKGDPDVEDCAHEALRRAIEGRGRLRPDEPIRPWLAGIARHVALDHRRAARRERARAGDEADAVHDPAPAPDDAAASRERARQPRDAARGSARGASRGAAPAARRGARLRAGRGADGGPDGDGGDVDRARSQGDRGGARRGIDMSADERDKLPVELSWDGEGHASEIALTALADGEDAALPEGVAAHVDGCDACMARLAVSALDAGVTAEAARAATAAREARAAAPVPWAAVGVAAAIVVVVAAPAVLDAPAWLERAGAWWSVVVLFTARVGHVVARQGAGELAGAAATAAWSAALALVMAGATLARWMRGTEVVGGRS